MESNISSVLMLIAYWLVLSASAQSFQQQCLNAHNSYRARHNAPPLVLDNNLNNFAQQWANHLLNINRMEHRTNNKYGENIYTSWGNPNVNGATPVASWYNEIRYYNYNNPVFSPQTGHFTQVVWRSSRRLGCAIARRGDKSFVVANYDPPGNYRGQFSQNVHPPR